MPNDIEKQSKETTTYMIYKMPARKIIGYNCKNTKRLVIFDLLDFVRLLD
ncbi:hypothetical protein T11_1486 [Trichinella zimbabwensis]|uniref:Uncharacterized protein n=1 Tax=Trichinella zimbabwensis TaxID=268475 RepID=A0A0V1GFV9_9BILA|nr:hypothetical protein T11_1486 [Trichinella zimbabwensis]